MNVILVMSDSFRYDTLTPGAAMRGHTPRLDEFTRSASVFTNAYLGSFPTIPNRLDIMSGRFSFIDHEWCPLPAETVTLQQILSASGVTTQLICDNPHMVEMGFNYERGYDAWEWIRGQETDHWRNYPADLRAPDTAGKNRSPWILENYLRNTAWWQREEDHFVARSITEACRWLEHAQHLPNFFLHLDLFDPHEPWDPPQKYVDLYDPGYAGIEVIFPQYEFWQEFLSPAELKHISALYLGEVSMVDHWFGVLLDKLEQLGLTEDTAVVFTSDHGYLFGEHDLTGKSRLPIIDGVMHYEAIPMYDPLRRVPLLIRMPGQTNGRRIDALTQSPDLMPTILEMAGLVATETIGGVSQTQALQCGVFYTSNWQFDPAAMHGKSLMPLLRGETKRLRDMVVCSNTLIHDNPILAKSAVVTDDGWCLHYAGAYDDLEAGGALFISKLIDPAYARTSTAPALFCLNDDPSEERNLIDCQPELARNIHQRYVGWLEDAGAPERYLAGRRRLRL